MRTIIIGNRKLARHLLRHTISEDWNVVGALVPEGKLATKQANFVPFSEIAADTECQIHNSDDINNTETFDWLQQMQPDLCLCGGWSQIIDKRVLTVPSYGFLGFHSSHLPKGRGGAPVNWSFINGADEVYISLFYYESGVDAGDILTQGSVSIENRDDIGTVFDKLANEACQILSSVREQLVTNEIVAAPQSISEATYRPRRQPQDGLINWNRDPETQYDWVRAQTEPYPGAYTFLNDNKLIVWDATPADVSAGNSAPGEVINVVPGAGVDVRTGDGVIRLTRIKHGNHASRWADRYADEIDLSSGDRLGRHQAPADWQYTGIRGPARPTAFDTNLTLGEWGELTVVSFVGSQTHLTVSATLNGESIFENSVTVSEEYRENVEYSPNETGTHSITVQFNLDGECIDTRYLKVFVHE
jgi:methionyl-tRNA formyltransferase